MKEKGGGGEKRGGKGGGGEGGGMGIETSRAMESAYYLYIHMHWLCERCM